MTDAHPTVPEAIPAPDEPAADGSEGGLEPTRRIFESYGRADASELAERLHRDLGGVGFEVWLDAGELTAGQDFARKIEAALRSCDVLVALLSPHSTRTVDDGGEDSLCLDEISMARSEYRKPVVPVMAVTCRPPLEIYRLHYVDFTQWRDPELYARQLAELRKGINEAMEGRVRLRLVVERLQPVDFGNFLSRKRRSFTGRQWLFDEIEAWRRRPNERALLITGDPGSGKSTIVAELVHRNPDEQVAAFHCCDSDTHWQPGEFVCSIAAMLASRMPSYEAAIERGRLLDVLREAGSDPERAFDEGILAPLAELEPPPGPAQYILVDALDQALVKTDNPREVTIVSLLEKRVDRFPEWLRLVATTRHARSVLDEFTAFTTKSINAQDARNLEDIEDYVAGELGDPDLKRLLDESKHDPGKLVTEIGMLSDGSFLYAQQVLDGLRQGRVTLDSLAELPPGVSGLYRRWFKQTFPDAQSYGPVKKLLSVLLDASGGLKKEGQLTGILDMSLAELEVLLAPLGGYLSEDDGVIRLFHKSLEDWLLDAQQNSLEFVIEPGAGAPLLLAYCRRWASLEDDFPLRRLPTYLARAGDVDGLRAVVVDPAFAERRTRAGVSGRVVVEDNRSLAHLLLKAGRVDEVVELARTQDTSRRDGVAVALREAGDELDATVKAVASSLATEGRDAKGADQLGAEQLNGRLVAITTASERGYGDLLAIMAEDDSPAVRGMLVPHLFRFWRARRDEGWRMLDELGEHFTTRLGVPRQELVETIGGLAMAIASEYFQDTDTMDRLGKYLARVVNQAISSPLRRAVGRGIVLKVGVAALTRVIREQPDYQPVNLPELQRAFPRPAVANGKALAVLEVLEHPEQGVDVITKILTGEPCEFDILLMALGERALIVQGARDPDGTFVAIQRIYREGLPWFQQSALYASAKILETTDPTPKAKAWLDSYAELMDDFVRTSRATLTTPTKTYSMSSAMAGIEVVFERHTRSGQARYLRRYFELAMAEGDLALAIRVVKAAHLVSLLRAPQLALDALGPVADAVQEHAELGEPLVEVLANIRLLENAAVDSFLRERGDPELTRQVLAATPTVAANEFPTMIDFLVNHRLITSEDGRREICGGFRRALEAKSCSDLLYDVLVWVIRLSTGK